MFFDTQNIWKGSYISEQVYNDEMSKLNHTTIVGGDFKKNSDILKPYVIKPQRVIVNEMDYYIARDIYKDTIYICYKNLMMIDIDYYKSCSLTTTLNSLIDFTRDTDYLFRIYTSTNGLHVFCISHPFNNTDEDTIKMMLYLNCDYYYALFSYIRGFCTRLTHKEKGKILEYKYLMDIGTGIPDTRLTQLVDLHIQYTDKYNDK